MERSFKKEVEQLRLGKGETFAGEGILAVTKGLLQSGVSYVGGYQGAPVSHLVDVLVDAEELMDELGVHVETCANEASAAAMLAASLNYPVRGAVTWKSIVGTNVAADALSHMASPGVLGGALVITGEDVGEGASIIQERTYAFAMKSTIWLLDPRPDLPTIVHMVEKGFELSEASNTPVMLGLRIRACHLQGTFQAKDNVEPEISTRRPAADGAPFDYGRIAHPPSTYVHEKLKVEQRLPAAQRFIVEQGLNEVIPGALEEVGIIVQGGLYNALVRQMQELGLADAFGDSPIPVLVLNVTYPLVPDQTTRFCAGKKAVLLVEEGAPAFMEQQIQTWLRQRDMNTRLLGKEILPEAGEYRAPDLLRGLVDFLGEIRIDGIDAEGLRDTAARTEATVAESMAMFTDTPLPTRPPSFCTGCPERPVFTALKLIREEFGEFHIASDIGCHSFATLPPFNMGNSILGFGMSLASAAAVAPLQQKRTIAVMGDGGFWHNGLQSGVLSALFNRGDAVLIIMQNGYTSATGQQYIPNSPADRVGDRGQADIATTLRSVGVRWLRTIRTYSVQTMMDTLRDALTTDEPGLKVIIADGECMLARQRRLKPEIRERLSAGKRVVRTRFGIDAEICTGDHACIRLSGCPSLAVVDSGDPFKPDPVTAIDENCVGCGLCGEAAHAAVLCPSFYKAEVISNPNRWDRFVTGLRRRVVGLLTRSEAA